MFQLRSERLRIIPLSQEQLALLLKGRNELEKSMGLECSEFELNADESFLKEFSHAIINYVIPLVEKNTNHYEWFTHWLIVHSKLNIAIGGIGAAGLPDENGQVMIGYFVDRKFEGQGFATETLSALLHWMCDNPKLKAVIADTPVNNFGSQQVLQKNGFKLIGEVEDGLRWRFEC